MKVGELAKRSGVTVRTLHHYDEIDLLTPLKRSNNGYRIYGKEHISRLHQIQALRRFGLSLSEISAYFAQPDFSPADIIARQIAVLKQQMEQASRLCDRLIGLQNLLQEGQEPDVNDWFAAMEMMTLYDNYFSQHELTQLPKNWHGFKPDPQWRARVDEINQLIASDTPPEAISAQEAAKRWMTLLVQDTKGDARLLKKLNLILDKEPVAQQHSGISTQVRDYVLHAFAESQMVVYEKYLLPDEAVLMRANYVNSAAAWPELMADVRDAVEAGCAPNSPQAKELAQRWIKLFSAYAGEHPDTQNKFRQAMQNEPALGTANWGNPSMFSFISEAIAIMAEQK